MPRLSENLPQKLCTLAAVVCAVGLAVALSGSREEEVARGRLLALLEDLDEGRYERLPGYFAPDLPASWFQGPLPRPWRERLRSALGDADELRSLLEPLGLRLRTRSVATEVGPEGATYVEARVQLRELNTLGTAPGLSENWVREKRPLFRVRTRWERSGSELLLVELRVEALEELPST